MTQNINAAGIILPRMGRFVAIKAFYHGDRYAFPAGGVEAGESPMQTAWREGYEELGVDPQTLYVGAPVCVVPTVEGGFAVFYLAACDVPLRQMRGSHEGVVTLATPKQLMDPVRGAFPDSAVLIGRALAKLFGGEAVVGR